MKKVSAKKNNMRDFLPLIAESKRELGEKLITEIEFQERTLMGLKKDVDEWGVTIRCKGSTGQDIVKQNPSLGSYTQVIRNYNATIKQLSDLLPDNAKSELDEFQSFLAK